MSAQQPARTTTDYLSSKPDCYQPCQIRELEIGGRRDIAEVAELAAAGARVCAVEKDPDRLALLNDNLSRLSLSAEVVEADILDYTPPHQSDFIILDAPCSATGTFRRHPDIFLHKKAPDLVRLQQTQIALLERSLNWVVDDGALLYVTCSLQPEEGEEVIETILATGQARLLPFTENELGIFAAACHPKGWARILPSCLDHISSQSVTIGTGCAVGGGPLLMHL